MQQRGTPFAVVHSSDESFHPLAPERGYEATETFYTGFNIPAAQLNCELYFWAHPQLGVSSGGVYIWRGVKESALQAEYVDYRNFMPLPPAPLEDMTLAMGLHHEIIDPLWCQRLSFEDEAAETALDVTLTGLCAPIGRPGGGHFVQPMKTVGMLTLRGEKHVIDGWFCRDRSWGEARTEAPRRSPPVTWCVGVFDDETAFHGVGFDTPESLPLWASAFPQFPHRNRFRWGYLMEGGQVEPVVDWRKHTRCRPGTLIPEGWDLTLCLADGREVAVSGEVKARLPISIWPNMLTHFCQTEWRMADRIGYGDAQEVQFNELLGRWTPDAP